MKVFLGWSGERSKALAEALREWLPLVLHYAQPWMSQTDIAAGERWWQEIASELEGCNFGVISLTKENCTDPWILFEAGSLAKSFSESRVVPLLLDLEFSDISGPLTQFQAKKADSEGLLDVIRSINNCCPEGIEDSRVRALFEALFPQLLEKIKMIPAASNDDKPKRQTHEVLEDLVGVTRAVETRLRAVEERFADEQHPRVKRKSPKHSLYLSEITREMDPNTAMLVLSGYLREEAPWLSDLVVEISRALNSKDKFSQNRAHELMRSFEVIMNSQMGLGLADSKEMHYTINELYRCVTRAFEYRTKSDSDSRLERTSRIEDDLI